MFFNKIPTSLFGDVFAFFVLAIMFYLQFFELKRKDRQIRNLRGRLAESERRLVEEITKDRIKNLPSYNISDIEFPTDPEKTLVTGAVRRKKHDILRGGE